MSAFLVDTDVLIDVSKGNINGDERDQNRT